MASNVQMLHDSLFTDSAAIGVVTEAVEGRAHWIELDGTPFPVARHFSGVEALRVGDEVLAIRVREGVVVTSRLCAEDEAPPPRFETRDGHLLVEAEKSVRLRAGEHRIEVHADGRIELDGCKITGYAEGRICLIGTNIELN